MNVEDLIAPHLLKMQPYTPIVPFDVLTLRLGLPRDQLVKLDANENPYGPSPRALLALENADALHIYPDPDQSALRKAISHYINVPAEHILCGAGADEVIDIIGRAFVSPGDAILDLPPTFGMYRFESDILHAQYQGIPRRADFSINVEAIIACAKRLPNAKLIFVANPNNPDGSLVSDADLIQLLALPLVVILDEAYIDFSIQPSRVAWVQRYDNLIVLRTFSKLAGLAGLRVGYGVVPLKIIRHLWKIKQPYTPNIAGSIAAIGALSDPDYLHDIVQRLTLEREELVGVLGDFAWLHIYPSAANFLLCRVDEGMLQRQNPKLTSAKQLKLELEQRGILVRYFDKEGLRDCIRISVGKPEDTVRLVNAVYAITQESR